MDLRGSGDIQSTLLLSKLQVNRRHCLKRPKTCVSPEEHGSPQIFSMAYMQTHVHIHTDIPKLKYFWCFRKGAFNLLYLIWDFNTYKKMFYSISPAQSAESQVHHSKPALLHAVMDHAKPSYIKTHSLHSDYLKTFQECSGK